MGIYVWDFLLFCRSASAFVKRHGGCGEGIKKQDAFGSAVGGLFVAFGLRVVLFLGLYAGQNVLLILYRLQNMLSNQIAPLFVRVAAISQILPMICGIYAQIMIIVQTTHSKFFGQFQYSIRIIG